MLGDRLVRRRQAEAAGFFLQHGADEEALERLVGDAELARLIAREVGPEQLPGALILAVEGARELGRGDGRIADARHLVDAEASRHVVADTPDPEAGNQDHEQGLGRIGGCEFANSGKHE